MNATVARLTARSLLGRRRAYLLMALPGVLISPHVGGASTAMMPRMARLLKRQIERMLRGEAPENVVLRS